MFVATDRRSAGRALAARSAALALLGALAAATVAAHPFLDDRLILLDEQIAAEPGNARLHLARGSLLLDEGHAAEALADFDRAFERDAALAIVHLLRARALLASGDTANARTQARRFLDLEPESARGWHVAARIEAIAGDFDAARDAFDRYFTLAVDPSPDDYLERAALDRSAARPDEAIRGIEQGVLRLGPLTSLLAAAFEIERSRERLAAALVWVDRLALSSPQEERWQLERARLLRELGRLDEARSALCGAEAALAQRSAAQRSAPAFRELAGAIERLRAELPAPCSAAGGER